MSTRTGIKHPFQSAFTLIELLVVISIISLMIAILLPALASARQAALDTRCKSNIRQFGFAAVTYAGDASGYCLTPQPDGKTVLGNGSWNGAWYDEVWEYLGRNWDVLECPSQKTTRADASVAGRIFQPPAPYPNRTMCPGYGINYSVHVSGNGTTVPIVTNKLDHVRRPQEKVYFVDTGFRITWNSTNPSHYSEGWRSIARYAQIDNGQGNTPSLRHGQLGQPQVTVGGTIAGGGSNVSWFDGHVSFMKWSDFAALTAGDLNFTRYWDVLQP